MPKYPLLLTAAAAIIAVSILSAVAADEAGKAATRSYRIVDTGQTHIFSDRGQLRTIPRPGQAFYGQDAFYRTNPPRYRGNGNGTVSDLVTGLMWVKNPGEKKTFKEATAGAKTCRVGGHSDWRLPTIKELYSLIDFNGCVTSSTPVPYIDTKYFDFVWGDRGKYGGRKIDSQFWSSTQYVGTTMGGNATVFGVNFADGRIKGYPRDRGRNGAARQYTRYVRGNKAYGRNQFVDNGDGTISDLATGLMWSEADNGKGVVWKDALLWCENLKLAGHDDWRLPDAKELQSIVDYTRAPAAARAASRGAAIDPVFKITTAESYFWSSTTHLDGPSNGARAVYVAFGRAWGYMTSRRTGKRTKMDVHGAGAQRSDLKSGDPSRFPTGLGPQGDDQRIYNYSRAVRNIDPAGVRVVRPSTQRLTHRFDPSAIGGGQGPSHGGTDSRRRPPPPHGRPPRY